MKRLQLVYIFLFFVSLAVIGQVNQVWWSNGRVLHVNPVAGIDSVTFGQFVNADTFLIVIDRASRRIVYDTINKHVPGMVFHDTIYTTHTVYLEPGRRIGVFSVAKDRQVSFSQGNLQYVRNQDVWKFADQQYEYIGAGNVKDGELANKIDLFGWSADNTTAPFGVSTSVNNTDYLGDFVDGSVNEINIDKPNMWRTLSRDEWEYLLNERENAKTLRGRAQVAGVNGLVFLPDNWISPEGIELNLDEQATKVFTIDQWHLLENEGAVFLPAAGRRQGLDLINLNDHGNYWSTTRKNSNYVEYLAFTHSTNKLYVDAQLEINLGRSVRLVHDTILPPPAPCEILEVNGVKFNMMCVEGGTFMMGATADDAEAEADEKPQHEVTLSDFHIGQTEVTQQLWQAVMGYNPSSFKGDNLPVESVSWDECQQFVEKLSQMTGLYFRLPTEAEWEYAARGGNRSKGCVYSGSNNADSVAWHIWNTSSLQEVGQLQPNELGIYDMTGNVWEYCSDYKSPYTADAQVNPQGSQITSSKLRVTRGGGWRQNPGFDTSLSYCRITNRASLNKSDIVGLRIVLDERSVFDEPKPSKRIGVFSVSKDRQVSFSQGNLQYVRNQDVWEFADQQYEYIGAGNVKDGELANKIDLFGWSADNTTAPFGVSTSTNAADYSGDFVDWGVNEINGEAPNTWRTLSQEEWGYIFESRKNAKQLYSKGSIDGVRGMIVLPDDWLLPEGLHFTAAPDNLTMDLDINIYTRAQWQKMEEAGAVFLCPTGRRDGLKIGYLVEYGGYWSSSRAGSNRVKHLYFNYESLIFNTNYNSGDQSYGYNGRAVRLVHDTIVPPPAPCMMVKVNDTLSINMMCVEGGTFMMGATADDAEAEADEKPQHEVTLSDYYIGQTEVTQELWTAVMGTTLEEERVKGGGETGVGEGDKLPMYCISWYDCQDFIAKLNAITGLKFRLPTEAEWEFAARGGNKSRGFLYSGSDNADEVAWHSNLTNGQVKEVGTLKANELGIYDMSGNVWEWVLDGYQEYSLEESYNPMIPINGQGVIRGGSTSKDWGIRYLRVSERKEHPLTAKRTRSGFRIVLDKE